MGKPLPGREVKVQPDGEVLVRGPMISPATWSGGALHQRAGEWLATGDLAETQATGELRFLGRKSETIVTGAGVNVHPEDLEAALEQEPEVAACAVVPVQTAIRSGGLCCAGLAWSDRSGPPLCCKARMHGWLSFSEFAVGRSGRSRIFRAPPPAR